MGIAPIQETIIVQYFTKTVAISFFWSQKGEKYSHIDPHSFNPVVPNHNYEASNKGIKYFSGQNIA